eukprot:GHVQ01015082.1.p1 GENE.GHVQ01015082.1~~GHVQ01015082.1.p1  ORF type:complete len:242 (+),score=43.79 GHVQ01015082.1:94-819(+)
MGYTWLFLAACCFAVFLVPDEAVAKTALSHDDQQPEDGVKVLNVTAFKDRSVFVKDTHDKNYAFVDAGSVQLFLGGGGINGAFGWALESCTRGIVFFDEFRSMQQEMLANAWHKYGDSEGEPLIFDQTKLPQEIVFAMYIHCPAAVALASKDPQMTDESRAIGFVSVSVMRKKNRYNGDENNAVMIYLVGPHKAFVSTKEDFLLSVNHSAHTLMKAVNYYNAMMSVYENKELGITKIEEIK